MKEIFEIIISPIVALMNAGLGGWFILAIGFLLFVLCVCTIYGDYTRHR
jgi:hypothetical protein